jgi:hypothetical protein
MALDLLMGTQSTQISTETGYRFDDVDSRSISIVSQTLFVEITGREMNTDDFASLNEMMRFPPQAIVAGMIASAIRNQKTPINSFRYFQNAIREMAETQRAGANLTAYSTRMMAELRRRKAKRQ